MAQNITLLGANYPDVPAVTLPITGGGTATFSDTRSVTYNLTGGATASVTPSEAVTGQGFSVKIKAPAGYELSNVSITMGGVDITSQVFTPDEQGGGGGGGGTYVRTEILASQTITPDSSQRRATLTGLTEGFVDGDYYIVTYDGVEWLTTCETLWSSNYCIGESQWFLGTGDYVYPFGVIWMSGTTATVAAANTNQHTIKIEHLEFIDDGVELGTKTITQSGSYNALSDGLDGYSSVNVNVQSGIDVPIFTLTWDSNYATILSATCDKTYAQCLALFDSANESTAAAIAQSDFDGFIYSAALTCNGVIGVQGGGEFLEYVFFEFGTPRYDIRFWDDGTITIVQPSTRAKTLNVTSNGTYTPEYGDYVWNEVIVDVPSGGASNVVIGSFTTGSTEGGTGSISIPYTGSGFPIACMVFIKGGAYNNTASGNTTWYNSTHRYAVGQWTYHNAQQSSSCNTGVTTWVYKNNASSATTYSRSSAMNTTVRTASNATGAGATCVRMSVDGKTLKWYVSSTSYGLLASTEYTYIMIYSS